MGQDSKRFTVFLDHGENSIELDEDLETEFNSRLIVRNAAVFWDHENIQTGINDTLVYNSNTVTFEPGYWTFDLIKDFLKENSIALERLEHNSKCKIQAASGAMNLEKFGLLLGFPENTTLSTNTRKTSPEKVNVNSSIRYVTISSNLVDRTKNFNFYGKRSTIISTLPITSFQNLSGTVTSFGDLNNSVTLYNGVHKRLHFSIGNNAGVQTKLTVLLELEIRM